MASDLINILDPHSDEAKESFNVFQQYYPSISVKFFLRSILLPLKRIGTKPVELGNYKIILDCVNTEKYKRMVKIFSSENESLIYVSDLSTLRSQKFCSELNPKLNKFYQKVELKNYWSSLLILLIKTLKEAAGITHFFSLLTYRARALQELIQYDWLLNKTGASTLVTANEDNWISPVLSLYCRINQIKNVNVMHGRIYPTKQFYDQSIVYGRTSEAATRKLCAPYTQVAIAQLDEITENKITDHFEFRKTIVLFDQPVFEHYSKKMQLDLYGTLENLVKNHGFTVMIKPHPAQTDLSEINQRPFQITKNSHNQELLLQCGIALGICSTVGIEVIATGVPMIYFNHERVLDHFLQISFLSDTSPKTIGELEALVLSLQEREFYSHYQAEQFKLLNTEYSLN